MSDGAGVMLMVSISYIVAGLDGGVTVAANVLHARASVNGNDVYDAVQGY